MKFIPGHFYARTHACAGCRTPKAFAIPTRVIRLPALLLLLLFGGQQVLAQQVSMLGVLDGKGDADDSDPVTR